MFAGGSTGVFSRWRGGAASTRNGLGTARNELGTAGVSSVAVWTDAANAREPGGPHAPPPVGLMGAHAFELKPLNLDTRRDSFDILPDRETGA